MHDLKLRNIHIIYLLIAAVGMFFILTHDEPINAWESPSGNFGYTPSFSEDGIVYLDLFDGSNEHIHAVRTGASVHQKWASGWHIDQDIVILYSSDIGTRAYSIKDDKLVELRSMTPDIESQATALYKQRYGSAP